VSPPPPPVYLSYVSPGLTRAARRADERVNPNLPEAERLVKLLRR